MSKREDSPNSGLHYEDFYDSDERDEFTDQDVQARDEEAERLASRPDPDED